MMVIFRVDFVLLMVHMAFMFFARSGLRSMAIAHCAISVVVPGCCVHSFGVFRFWMAKDQQKHSQQKDQQAQEDEYYFIA